MQLPKSLMFHFFITLAFIAGALVTASPVDHAADGNLNHGPPTATLDEAGTPIGPRRNGFSDIPLTLSAYNFRELLNQIPNYIMGTNVRTDPNGLNGAVERDALLYSADEVFQALSQGYEVLQRTRDPANTGQLVNYGNVDYPNEIDLMRYDIDTTDLGRFDYLDVGSIYIWPLTWAGVWNGHNQNPGDDRVVFNQDGVYLGVITRRTDAARLAGAGSAEYRWCAGTNSVGIWTSIWMGADRGWSYPGQPPDGQGDGAEAYQRPSRWLTASAQRTLWYKHNPGVPPFTGGGSRVEVDPDTLFRVSGFFDDSIYTNASDPLDWPPEDNSTGTLREFVRPSAVANTTSLNSTSAAPAEYYGPTETATSDCLFAAAHPQKYYWQSCQAAFTNNQLQYRVTIAGTGQKTDGWCGSLLVWIMVKCGAWADHLVEIYSCDEQYTGTLAWIADDNATWLDAGTMAYGIDMHFTFDWPWCAADANHRCVSDAIQAASCGSQGVTPINGLWCRDVAYKNASEVEYGQDYGTPAGHC